MFSTYPAARPPLSGSSSRSISTTAASSSSSARAGSTRLVLPPSLPLGALPGSGRGGWGCGGGGVGGKEIITSQFATDTRQGIGRRNEGGVNFRGSGRGAEGRQHPELGESRDQGKRPRHHSWCFHHFFFFFSFSSSSTLLTGKIFFFFFFFFFFNKLYYFSCLCLYIATVLF